MIDIQQVKSHTQEVFMKKRGAPAHLQKPVFVHPAANSSLITILEKLPDPRGISPNFSYSLTSILFIATVTMLCGAEDWEQISALAEGMQEWLSHYVDVSSGIPDIATILLRVRTHITCLFQFFSNSSGEKYPRNECALCRL